MDGGHVGSWIERSGPGATHVATGRFKTDGPYYLEYVIARSPWPRLLLSADPNPTKVGQPVVLRGIVDPFSRDLSLRYTFEWDFGDGSPRVRGPEKDWYVLTHRYDRPGAYNVRLTVVDSAGGAARASARVLVGDIAVVAPSIVPGEPLTLTGTAPGRDQVWVGLAGEWRSPDWPVVYTGTQVLTVVPVQPDGSFTAVVASPLLPPGTPQVCVGSAGPDLGAAPDTCQDADVKYKRGIIAGTVFGHEFGGSPTPLPGATVDLIGDRGLADRVTTGSDGTYRLTNVPIGIPWTLRAYKDERDAEGNLIGRYLAVNAVVKIEPGQTSAQRDFDLLHETNTLPEIRAIQAQHNGRGGDDIGTPVLNRLTPEFDGAPTGVARVQYMVDHVARVGTPEDGFAVEFEMSRFSPGVHTLAAVPFDAEGRSGPVKEVRLHIVPAPNWLAQPWVVESSAAWDPTTEKYTFRGVIPNDPAFRYENSYDLDLIGTVRNYFESDVEVIETIDLEGRWSVTANGKLKATILDINALDKAYPLRVTYKGDRTLEAVDFTLPTIDLGKREKKLFEGTIYRADPWVVINLSIDIGFNATLNVQGTVRADLSIAETRLTPGISPYLDIVLMVDILFGLAKAEAGITPAMGLYFPIVYRDDPPPGAASLFLDPALS